MASHHVTISLFAPLGFEPVGRACQVGDRRVPVADQMLNRQACPLILVNRDRYDAQGFCCAGRRHCHHGNRHADRSQILRNVFDGSQNNDAFNCQAEHVVDRVAQRVRCTRINRRHGEEIAGPAGGELNGHQHGRRAVVR